MIKKQLLALFFIFVAVIAVAQESKAPSYPLITHDAYFSIWSSTDQLNASVTNHWTGAEQSLLGIIKVDGKSYRFLGNTEQAYNAILPSSEEQDYNFSYTENTPSGDWKAADYSAGDWKTGAAPFGDVSQFAKTAWKSKNLWVRRSFDLADPMLKDLALKLNHDDNIEVYLNGSLIYSHVGWTNNKFLYIC
ncbi:MAG: DUF4964 domain-containing protein [Pedobacter sp.]